MPLVAGSGGGTSLTTTNNRIYSYWVAGSGGGTGGGTTSTSSTSYVWSTWTSATRTATGTYDIINPQYNREPKKLTPEEQEENNRQAAASLARMEKAKQERNEAKKKSIELLLSFLDKKQKDSFNEYRYFYVIGGETGTKYRIRENQECLVGNIDVFNDNGMGVSHRICIHPDPQHNCPIGDALLSQMLGLKFNEKEYVKKANRHRAYA